MVIFYKKWKKYNEIQLTKNKMDLNIRKMANQPPSPVNNEINGGRKQAETSEYGKDRGPKERVPTALL